MKPVNINDTLQTAVDKVLSDEVDAIDSIIVIGDLLHNRGKGEQMSVELFASEGIEPEKIQQLAQKMNRGVLEALEITGETVDKVKK